MGEIIRLGLHGVELENSPESIKFINPKNLWPSP